MCLKATLWKWPGRVALGTESGCVDNKDESVAPIIPSSPANSQALSLPPSFPFFLSLTPPSKCSLASVKVHINLTSFTTDVARKENTHGFMCS